MIQTCKFRIRYICKVMPKQNLITWVQLPDMQCMQHKCVHVEFK
jgi:hypothetical protein